MGKHREITNEYEFEDDSAQAMLNDVEYGLDDQAFFEQFEPKKTRRKTKRARDARRRIEEYWENRQLADRLDEYYYHSDD